MGAIELNGYRFEPEYSVINQNGALHVYRQGEFIKEIQFCFTGDKPSQEQLESLISSFMKEHL